MLVVTGCKRSGTSLWMQILIAAGFPHIGKDFWVESVQNGVEHGYTVF